MPSIVKTPAAVKTNRGLYRGFGANAMQAGAGTLVMV